MQDNLKLREQYPEFIYDSCEVNRDTEGIHVKYVYKLGEHSFEPTVNISVSDISNSEFNVAFVEYLFFNFGIINAINYYKLSCAPKFTINAGYLDDNQKEFFKKLFYNGLGEFMYVNQLNIPYENFMEIETAAAPKEQPDYEFGDLQPHGNLIPVGGGKDSVVTLEALQSMHADNLCLQYNRDIYPENRAAHECIAVASYSNDAIMDFNLTLDKHMLELNQQGFYNGHIPFSSCLAFAAYIMAYLNNKENIVLSNEASANEGNIPGTNINHQYSKSFEFENDFRHYCDTYFTPKIRYFSLLRCINEYTIVQKFLKFPRYLDVFRSCNVGQKTNTWCGHCAKCLYVFIMLYPFVPIEKLQQIFGQNMLNDQSLFQVFMGLVNPDMTKPFECVGTREEINYSLKLAVEHTNGNLPVLLDYYKQNLYNPQQVYNVENFYNPQHNIPEDYLNMLAKLWSRQLSII